MPPWTLISLAIALVVALLPLLAPLIPRAPTGQFLGRPYTLRRVEGRHGQRAVVMETPLPTRVAFELDRERPLDRRATAAGLLSEAQTGDEVFDRTVFIACDHPALGGLLRSRAEARHAALEVLWSGIPQIACDGIRLRVVRRGRLDPAEGDLARLDRLARALEPLAAAVERSGVEPYALRSMAFEGSARLIGTFGILNGVTWLFGRPTQVLELAAIAPAAVAIGVLTLVALGVVLASMLRTARAGRNGLAWGAYLLIGLAPASLQVAIELNRHLDRVEPVSLRCEVLGVEHGWRGAATRNQVTLGDCSPEGAISPPELLTVEPRHLRRIRPGGELLLRLGPGALGAPWLYEARPI